jgi:integrase
VVAPKSSGRDITFSTAVKRWLRDLEVADRSPSTVQWYELRLNLIAREKGFDRVTDLDRDSFEDYVAGLRQAGKSPAYVRGWYRAVQAFLNWCRQEGVEISPSMVSERGRTWFAPKKPTLPETHIEIYDEEALDRIFDAAGSARNRVFLQLLAGTGLRLDEALSLTLDDIEDDRIRVKRGKGRKVRFVPISPRLAKSVERWVERDRPEGRSDRLFVGEDGRPLSRPAVFSIMARIKRRTGLRVHAHGFRHTFATTYLRKGGELERLRRILGHTSYTVVSRYVHLAGADLGRDIGDLAPY